MFWFAVPVLLAALPLWSQAPSSPAQIKSPDLDSILQHMEDAEHPAPAQSRPYRVTREYKVFMGADQQPTSDVTAQIDFVPPATETFTITHSTGNPWGEKIIRDLLISETASARQVDSSAINRSNYDFVFVRQQNFGEVPEYNFAIFPKRRDRLLLRGQIWVDKSTFRIRQIQGVPAESPSFWLSNLNITFQYAEVAGQWILVTVDGLAKVRFLGQFTLTGLNTQPPEPFSPQAN